jgi:hypothetical protein
VEKTIAPLYIETLLLFLRNKAAKAVAAVIATAMVSY